MTRPVGGSAFLLGLVASDPDITLEEAGAILMALTLGEGAAQALAEETAYVPADAVNEARRPAGQHQRR